LRPLNPARRCISSGAVLFERFHHYHPDLFNDRLLLGLKGTMAEAERHVLLARLDGGILNKAARGELRRGLPVGLIWGDNDGEVFFTPTRRSSAPCAACVRNLPSWVPPAGSGYGFARKTWPFRINALTAKSSGSNRPIPPYLEQSRLCRRLCLW
jgi:pimeloyl-ACP methyl ester carboxylesterase